MESLGDMRAHNEHIVRLREELESTPDAARRARELVREPLVDQLPAGTLADLLTLVTELVNNASEHGGGGPITISLAWSADEIVGKVQNPGARPPAASPITRDPNRGLGLHIVEAIADEWWPATVEGDTIVTFCLART